MKTHQASIRGRIVCAKSKEPVAGADIRAGIRVGMDTLCMSTTSSDADGIYATTLSWDGPEVAPIYIDVRATGYKAALWPWHFVEPEERSAATGQVRAGDEVSADIELGAGFGVEVLVEAPDGRPLPDVESIVICTSTEAKYCYWPLVYHISRPEGRDSKTDADGRLLWLGFPAEIAPGEHFVIAMEHKEYPEYLIQCPEHRPRENHIARISIRLNKGIDLCGRVTDRAGNPIENTGVRARLIDKSGAVPRCHLVQKTRGTDSRGHYRIRGLDPGLYSIRAMHGDWQESTDNEYELAAGGQTLDFQLSRGAEAAGCVLDPQGLPVAGEEIRASWSKPQYGTKSAVTDKEGRFRLQGLPVRQGYSVHAYTPGNRAAHGYARVRGWRTDLTFDGTKQAQLSGHLVEPFGTLPVPLAVRWTAWAEAGRVIMGRGLGEAADGSFDISIPIGTTAIAMEAGGRYYAIVTELPAPCHASTGAQVTAQAGATLSVRVTDASTGHPIPDASVNLNLGLLWRRGDKKTTDRAGEVMLRDHPPGGARLQVVCPGYKSSPLKRLNLGAGSQRRIVCRLEKETGN